MSTIAPFQAPDAGFAPTPLRVVRREWAAEAPQHAPLAFRQPVASELERIVYAPTITTKRLILRQHTLRDAEAWLRIQADREVTRYLPWPERTRDESRAHLERRTRHNSLAREDDFLALAVEHNGELIGDVSMHLRAAPETARQIEVGWLLNSAYSGRGFALEAARGILRFGFETVGARAALAVIDERNTRSLTLARRLGFVHQKNDRGSCRMVLIRQHFFPAAARSDGSTSAFAH